MYSQGQDHDTISMGILFFQMLLYNKVCLSLPDLVYLYPYNHFIMQEQAPASLTAWPII